MAPKLWYDRYVDDWIPALPRAWHTGCVKGIKARGDITLDMAWKDGALTEVTLLSPVSRRISLKLPGDAMTSTQCLTAGEPLTLRPRA